MDTRSGDCTGTDFLFIIYSCKKNARVSNELYERINNKIKHLKPSQKDKIGKMVNFSAPLHISNVMICNSEGVISRIGFINSKEGKVRVFKKTKIVMLVLFLKMRHN